MGEDKTKAKKKRSWLFTTWRPLMAFQYLAVCLFDFMLAPICTAMFYYWTGQAGEYAAWKPITLQGGGTYHLAMMAIVGVSAWSHGREKMEYWKRHGFGCKRDCPDSEADEPGSGDEEEAK